MRGESRIVGRFCHDGDGDASGGDDECGDADGGHVWKEDLWWSERE